MVFKIAKKNVKTSVNINVNNFSLEKVNSTKFLGVIIDYILVITYTIYKDKNIQGHWNFM